MAFACLTLINSKNDFNKFWNYIDNHDEISLGNYVIISGSLTCKDGRTYGKEGEIMAGIIMFAFKKEPIDKTIEWAQRENFNSLLLTDLSPKDLTITKEGAQIINKIVKDFEKSSSFKKYLRERGFDI